MFNKYGHVNISKANLKQLILLISKFSCLDSNKVFIHIILLNGMLMKATLSTLCQ